MVLHIGVPFACDKVLWGYSELDAAMGVSPFLSLVCVQMILGGQKLSPSRALAKCCLFPLNTFLMWKIFVGLSGDPPNVH